MDTNSVVNIAKYIAKPYNRDYREILGDVWLSINNGANRIYIVRMNVIDTYRRENRKRLTSRIVITDQDLELTALKTYRPEPSLLSIWNEYRVVRDRAKLNAQERLYLYLWCVEGWLFKEIARVFKISPPLVCMVTKTAQHKLGLE